MSPPHATVLFWMVVSSSESWAATHSNLLSLVQWYSFIGHIGIHCHYMLGHMKFKQMQLKLL